MVLNLMLDLETWGTEPGCDIRSIGACVFDPVTGTTYDGSLGTIKPFYIACDNPPGYHRGNTMGRFYSLPEKPGVSRKYPLHRDPRTVQWWSEQSDEAQAAFADPVDLRDALVRFAVWLESVSQLNPVPRYPDGICTDLAIWSHGAHFDGPILAAAYKAVGLPVPWHYRAPRDTRTCFDMAGIDDHSAWLKQHPGPLGIPHHALDDAICQARAVCAAWEKNRKETVDKEGKRWAVVDIPHGAEFHSDYIASMGDMEDRN